jgi:polyphosphate kinase 2 (PPK2 family)
MGDAKIITTTPPLKLEAKTVFGRSWIERLGVNRVCQHPLCSPASAPKNWRTR